MFRLIRSVMSLAGLSPEEVAANEAFRDIAETADIEAQTAVPEAVIPANADPVIAALPAHLHQPHAALDPEDYGFIRTLGEKFGASREAIARMQGRYAEQVTDYAIFVSQPDEFPGFRRVIVGGSLALGNHTRVNFNLADQPPKGDEEIDDEPSSPWEDIDTKHSLVAPPELNVREKLRPFIAVTDDGLLISGLFADPKDQALSLTDLISRLRDGDIAYRPAVFDDMTINIHSKLYRDMILGMVPPGVVILENSAVQRPHAMLQAYRNIMQKRARKRLNLVCYAIRTSLDPEILRLMRSTQMMTLRDAAWFSGLRKERPLAGSKTDARHLGSPISAFNNRDNMLARIQAVRAYPILSRDIQSFMTQDVDARVPLAQRIAQFYKGRIKDGLSEKNVKLLLGITWQKAGVRPCETDEIISLLLRTPPHAAPKNRAEIRALRQMEEFSPFFGTFEESIAAFSRGGSPYRHAADMARVPFADVRDAARHVIDKLLAPMLLHAIAREEKRLGAERFVAPLYAFDHATHRAMLRLVTGRKSAKEIFEFSDRWHRGLARHEQEISRYIRHAAWSPLVGGQGIGKTGAVARELSSSTELKVQGRSEGHCVGGYDGQVSGSCKNNIVLIFSIEKDGAVMSTVEFRGALKETKRATTYTAGEDQPPIEKDHYAFEIMQNRGKRNDDPGKEAHDAAEVLRRHLENLPKDTVDEYLDGLEQSRRSASSFEKLPRHIKNAGYNIWDRDSLSVAWSELSPYLPKKMRKAGLDAAIDMLARSELVGAFHHLEGIFSYKNVPLELSDSTACAIFEGRPITEEDATLSEDLAAHLEHDLNEQIPF
ncbi:hypothetical protein ACEUZ9_004107 [Paracoccus litorisediminis]|uniref:hypothetical protein n=1 Tax=Paracoccus litorisediminis TaxID=2006130 RepID=UPI00372E7239